MNIGSTYGCQVTVTLISEHVLLRAQTFGSSSQGRCTSVCRLLPVDVDVVVCEYGAADRTDAYGLVLDSHFLYDFGYEFVHCPVRAARTVVHDVVSKQCRFPVHYVFRSLYIQILHDVSLIC